MIRGSNPVINICQRVLDVAILIGVTRSVSGRMFPEELSKVLMVYCSLLMVVVFSLFNMYQSWRKTGARHQIRNLTLAWLTVLAGFNLIIILLSNKEQLAILTPFGLFASAGFNLWALIVYGGLAAARLAVRAVLGVVRSRGHNQQVAVIIGAGDTGRKLARYLTGNKWIGIDVAGFFDDKIAAGTALEHGSKLLGTVVGPIDACREFIVRRRVDLVFLALPMRAEEKITRIVGSLGTSGHAVLMVQDLFSFGIQKARTQQLGELQLMDFYLFPMWKRGFDIVFSLLVLLLSFPLWIGIMAAIKAEDGGPVFFRHPRVMEGGKRFRWLKFRSMHIHAQAQLEEILARDPSLKQEWQASFKLRKDPRVTRVGKFLRRFSMDELPQFLNVLSGEMSVVGARPVVPEELERYYREVTLTYCAMKPGITGLWQVSPQSGTMDYDQRVELDRRYILNCTLWMDIMIIAKTVWRIVFENAADREASGRSSPMQ
jgi:putative colanic acid biosysnthesis UDP-glucose lipid carrier transferase